MLTVGLMAKQYHMLPSEVISRATTYDVEVFKKMMTWEAEQRDLAEGKKPTPNLSQDQMQAMLNRVRSKQ